MPDIRCEDCKWWEEMPPYGEWAGGCNVVLVKQGKCTHRDCPAWNLKTAASFGCVLFETPPYVVCEMTNTLGGGPRG